MKFLSIIEKVVRRHHVVRPDGPYCEDQWDENVLVRTTRVFGIPVASRIVDQERIPEHVLIEIGALGTNQTAWRSKFLDAIRRQELESRAS